MNQIFKREVVKAMIKTGDLNCRRGKEEEDFYPSFPTDHVYITIEITPNEFSDPIKTYVSYTAQTITGLPRFKLKKEIRDWINENYNIGDRLVIERIGKDLYRFRLPRGVSDGALNTIGHEDISRGEINV